MDIATLAPFINFAILLAILFFLGRKPLQQMFSKNRLEFEEKKHLAREAITKAETQYKEIKSKWDNLASELDEVKKQSLGSLQKESTEVVENAKSMAEFIKNEAKKTSEVEVDLARKKLSSEIMEAVTAQFQKELKGSGSSAMHQDIMKKAITSTQTMEI